MAFSEPTANTKGATGANGEAARGDGSSIDAARETVRRMVSPGGCAWHEVQTHESLIPFLIEETAEFVDAVERGLSASEVAAELGDVLYQVLFHAAIAERDGEGYDLDAVAARLNEKLIARHPHVFGDRGYMTVDELHAEWERLKEDAAGERRGSRGALEGIPAGMPTLARSAKVVERLKRAHLIDPAAMLIGGEAALPRTTGDKGSNAGPDGTIASASTVAREDTAGSEGVVEQGTSYEHTAPVKNEQELGEAILSLIIQANAAGLDPDRALRLATTRLAEQLGAD